MFQRRRRASIAFLLSRVATGGWGGETLAATSEPGGPDNVRILGEARLGQRPPMR